MIKFLKSLFKPKFKVPVSQHGEYIVDRMIQRGHDWRNKNTYECRDHFWDWLEHEFGVKQQWSWREKRNYMVFRDEQHYMTFLLSL